MKTIKTKQIQKEGRGRLGKYYITLEVNDNDIEMLENFATTLAPNEVLEVPSEKNAWNGLYSPDYKKKYQRWIFKLYSCVSIVWNKYPWDKE